MMRYWERLVSGQRQGFGAFFLRAMLGLLSVPYRLALYLRRLAYALRLRRRHRLGVPVISVGNLTLGGTGKTPMVLMLHRWLEARGVPHAILARGYGAEGDEENDEAREAMRIAPEIRIYIGANRLKTGGRAVKDGAEVVILDDGFQHWRLLRDLDIVLVDATRPFGYGRLFPRGMLREPVGALRRADVIVLTRADVPPRAVKAATRIGIERLAPGVPVLEAEHRPVRLVRIDKKGEKPLEYLKGRDVLAFCGTGNPSAVFIGLAKMGAKVRAFHALDDHARYGGKLVGALEDQAKRLGCKAMVTTLKDGVKLEHFEFALPVYALEVEMVMTSGEDILRAAVERLLGKGNEPDKGAGGISGGADGGGAGGGAA